MKHCYIILLLVAQVLVSYSQTITDGLIFYYPLDGDATDMSGNGLDATVNGASAATDHNGMPNKAMYFDGVNDYIEFPNSTLIEVDPPITMSFWVNTGNLNQADNGWIYTDYEYNDHNGFYTHVNNNSPGSITLSMGGGQSNPGPTNRRTKYSATGITTNTWHHIVGVIRSGTDMDIYIDCVDAGGTYGGSGSMNVGYSSEPGRMGSRKPDASQAEVFFEGYLDEVAFWGRELMFSEVTKLCNDPLSIQLQLAEDARLIIGPNPSKGLFNYRIPSGHAIGRIEIFNVLGAQLNSTTVAGNTGNVDLSEFGSGIYLANFVDRHGTTNLVKKLVVE